jgi:hypothetical protein
MIQGRALIVNDFRLKKTRKNQNLCGFAALLQETDIIRPDCPSRSGFL